ncbi:putative pre-mRNA cleavage complex subunit Clp1, P-loop containing nucleoside triphosphate hydrolase [Helianthus annuus]|nr:putative pre-mRNA cleavage complex subunit Clp1, P-loop containing nucleoside triphosphate hydrolase [Helianthus annuus]
MAYGGATSGPAVGSSPAMKQVKLEKESELRIEVNVNSSLRLRLLNGSAEIFGTEMPPENWLIFPPRMKFAVNAYVPCFTFFHFFCNYNLYIAASHKLIFRLSCFVLELKIFTWYGATIEMQDNTETDYVADETPMISYVNVHAVLEGRRNRAKASVSDTDSSQGPRVIVVGPTDSGKSTLSRMLLSWAAKQGWKPTFVDLDIGQGSITLPGCIAATPIEMPIDPVEGIPLEMPLVYFYGHNTPTVNADLYRVLVKELAQILERQFAGNAESRAAGMVINTMGFIDGLGYDLLLHAIDTFQATVVLVMGQDKLCSMLKDVLKQKPNVDVVKLQKSGGVVSRNSKFRAIARNQRIREYFYGLSNDLSPHSSIANFSDLAIYRIGGGPQAPASALPIGAQPVADPMRLVPVNINRDLLNLVLAVSFAKDQDQILSRYCRILAIQ